jgi:hypothetical protein
LLTTQLEILTLFNAVFIFHKFNFYGYNNSVIRVNYKQKQLELRFSKNGNLLKVNNINLLTPIRKKVIINLIVCYLIINKNKI